MKRLALFLDGTWNDPSSNTNVWRSKELLAETGSDEIPQKLFYQEGVGNKWYEPVSGGAFGNGLSEKVLEAYQWLRENYDDGGEGGADEIFLFGYSRGAYTARSVAGLIARCGLLRAGSRISSKELYDRYQGEATPIYTLDYWKRHSDERERDLTAEEEELLLNSRRVDIKFLGVWDTVGALGIPFADIPGVSSKRFAFHNTRLSKIYKNCYHALAVDEHRKPFKPTLWTRFIPDNSGEGDTELEQVVEQRWFVGAHSNVGGGGSSESGLSELPLHWMLDCAQSCGLTFRTRPALGGGEHLDEITDSYARFLKGFYRILKFGRRFYRVIMRKDREVVARQTTRGRVETVNEVIDDSVIERMKADEDYRPPNLERWYP